MYCQSSENTKAIWNVVFIIACQTGRKDVVQLLLSHSDPKIELNVRDNDGWTAFMWACANRHKDVAKLLLDHSNPNIDLNVRSFTGETAILHACKNGHKNIVQLLLNHSERIDLNARYINGYTPL